MDTSVLLCSPIYVETKSDSSFKKTTRKMSSEAERTTYSSKRTQGFRNLARSPEVRLLPRNQRRVFLETLRSSDILLLWKAQSCYALMQHN